MKDFTGNCQYVTGGSNCAVAAIATCANFVAIGADTQTKATYCYGLAIDGAPNCGYSSGDMCAASTCA